jgi:Co/Zn/Cd efflux system component
MSDPEESACGCTGDADRAGRDPAYRRALWWVVILNISFGAAELIGGFIARSQAVKADSLDFLGDGSITFIGLLALAWSAAARARVALVQGIFLAALGVWVLGMAMWRAMNAVLPEAELMGGLGLAGLVVNVTAALILARFREAGDAQARAIWLYSRNDAINSAAVVVAAAFVFWLDSAWPDLIVAGVIAAIFLQSAWEIIRDARVELRAAS